MREYPLEQLGETQRLLDQGIPVEFASDVYDLESTGWTRLPQARWLKGATEIAFQTDPALHWNWEVHENVEGNRRVLLAVGMKLQDTITAAARKAEELLEQALRDMGRWNHVANVILCEV